MAQRPLSARRMNKIRPASSMMAASAVEIAEGWRMTVARSGRAVPGVRRFQGKHLEGDALNSPLIALKVVDIIGEHQADTGNVSQAIGPERKCL